MKKIKILIPLILMFFLSSCYDRDPIEKLTLISGAGYDINETEYTNSIEYLIFKGNKVVNREVIKSTGETLYESKNRFLLKTSKENLIGNIRTYIIGEQRAREGIKDLIDVYIRDYDRRLTPILIVCEGSADNILRLMPKNSITMGEVIEGLLETSANSYFFNHKAELKDIIYMYFQEGRRMIIPYIRQVEDRVEVAGLGVFEEDKLVKVVPLKEAFYTNLLRNDKAVSYINQLPVTKNQYISLYGRSKRRVKVTKENDKIKYNIEVKIKGDIKVDSEHEKIDIDKASIKEIEEQFSRDLEANLNNIIYKYQKEDNMDIFDIEKFSHGKFKEKELKELNSSFKDAIVNVNVRVKVNSTGRLY
ncbi:Ger(x)C family spore germination protein [Clostridium hydrogeniformans]|uniref:Ger(x)C family spore germination protein n=1 Tax=Clostridium hydrogeniformans TaxID=349933 RepID=UPI000488D7A9|nr:Ger(x)C family spore germination protein [Clostridium hydrogeniformans]